MIVGHTIRHDLAVIGHRHPTSMTRDIAQCQTLRRMYQHKQKSYNRLPIIGLKKLSAVLLGERISVVPTLSSLSDESNLLLCHKVGLYETGAY